MKRSLSMVLALAALAGCGAGSSKKGRTTPEAAAAVPGAGDPRFDATLSQYPYPYPVQVFEVPYGGAQLRMAYMDVRPADGARSNGRAVLLLHGKNFGAFYWKRTIELLVGEGYRVIAPDQLGFGKSDKPRDYAYSFFAYAENTRALLDLLAVPKVDVVGHSMGGMLAARFALLHPERTRSLALVNPIGLEDWSAVVPYRSVDEWYARERKATPDSIRAY